MFVFLDAVKGRLKGMTTISTIKPAFLIRSFAHLSRHPVILEGPMNRHWMGGEGPLMARITRGILTQLATTTIDAPLSSTHTIE